MTYKGWPIYPGRTEYIGHYIFLLLGVFLIIPVVFNKQYTELGFVVNFIWADWLFMKWCQMKDRKKKEAIRLQKLKDLKGDNYE